MSLDTDIAMLSRTAPLSALSRDALRLLAFSGDRRRLRAGDVLFRKGMTTTGAGIVITGAIGLDEAGDGTPATYIARPGTLIGELALVVSTSHQADAIAREPSEVLVIPRSLFRRVLEEFPDQAVAVHAAFEAKVKTGATDLARVAALWDPAP